MSMKQEMEAALQAAFAPSALEVVNESHKHAGHAGDDGSGESHGDGASYAADDDEGDGPIRGSVCSLRPDAPLPSAPGPAELALILAAVLVHRRRAVYRRAA